MAGKRRTEPPRFAIGDYVEIGDCIATRYVSETGLITEIQKNARSRTLDRYTVHLSSGDKAVFWDIQLMNRRSPNVISLAIRRRESAA